MAITQAQLTIYQTQILNATNVAEETAAVTAYYDYLTAEGDFYGAIGKAVANDTTNYGQFANDVLEANGFADKIDALRVDLALADIGARDANIRDGGDGSLTARDIADYHYITYEDPSIGIPRSNWGGAFFEEFVGTGSWVTIAETGNIPAGNITNAMQTLIADLVFGDQPDVNGVDIGDAAAALEAAVDTTSASQIPYLFEVGVSGLGALNVENPTDAVGITAVAVTAGAAYFMIDPINAVIDTINDGTGPFQGNTFDWKIGINTGTGTVTAENVNVTVSTSDGKLIKDYIVEAFDELANFGSDLVVEITDAVGTTIEDFGEVIDDVYEGAFNLYANAMVELRTAADPIVLDLDNDGVELTNALTAPVPFDITGDGVLDDLGWVAPDDGLLIRDYNGNGVVDGIGELYGDRLNLGFNVLRGEDAAEGNGDGLITVADAFWNELYVWQDTNQDGISQACLAARSVAGEFGLRGEV